MQRASSKLSPETLAKLKGQKLFREISEELLASAVAKAEDIHLLKGELAFRKGESYHKGIYFVLKGRISLTRAGSHIKISCENEAVGLSTFLGKTMYTMNATAETDCDLLFIRELYIYRLMELSEEFRSNLIENIRERLVNLENASNTFMMQPASQGVGSRMSSPPITVQSGKSVTEAARLMKEHRVGSLLVVNRKQIVKGLITSRHIIERFASEAAENLKRPEVERYMDAEPLAFPLEFPTAEALNKLQATGASHAVVIKNGKPAGIITEEGLALALLENSNLHCSYIDSFETLDQAKKAFVNIYKTAKAVATSSRVSREALKAVSAVHWALLKKVFQITADDFKKEYGFTLSDHIYCQLILGSAARGETDLDPEIGLALVLNDKIDGETFNKFREFAKSYGENLRMVGYRLKDSETKTWEKRSVLKLADWKKEIDSWASKEHTEASSPFSWVLDAAVLDGDPAFERDIKNSFLKRLADKPSILAKLLQNIPPIKVPVSQFGSFIVEKEGPKEGMFDLEGQALRYLAGVVRILAAGAGIKDTGTVERLERLARKKVISWEMASQAITAFDTTMETLINEQVNQASQGLPVTSYISPSSLSLFYQEKLKRALHFLTIFISYGTNLLKKI